MSTPITDRAEYWHTAEGGDVVNPEDMRALERIAGELYEALWVCKSQTSALRTWNGMGWSYHPPQAKRIHDTAEAALSRWQAMKDEATK